MKTVGIHQPNYLPWLGYFHKIARSDVFVFLDDVQFSKNGYCNRVQILQSGKPRWLSIPVSYKFGDVIENTTPAQADWPQRHIDTFRTTYAKANHFKAVWSSLKDMFDAIPAGSLAQSNRYLIEAISGRLDLSCQFDASSSFETKDFTGDDRLIQIVKMIEPGSSYLSGSGGANYQDKTKFVAAGLSLKYTEFEPAAYGQNIEPFVPGLSIVDAIFHLGWEETARLTIGRV